MMYFLYIRLAVACDAHHLIVVWSNLTEAWHMSATCIMDINNFMSLC